MGSLLRLAFATLLAGCGGGSTGAPVVHGPPRHLHAESSRGSVEARTDSDGEPSECLMLFFPGLGDEASSFDVHGFTAHLAAQRLRADIAVMEARDYPSDDYSERLHSYVEEHANGRNVWLVSVSMGGSAAIRYAAAHSDDVTGMVLIAPAMGGPFFAKDIENIGGPRSIPEDEANRDLRAARWLAYRDREAGSATELHLAYGDRDALAPLSEALAPDLLRSGAQVLVGSGGHNWGVWYDLWRGLVDSGFLQRSCGASRSHD